MRGVRNAPEVRQARRPGAATLRERADGAAAAPAAPAAGPAPAPPAAGTAAVAATIAPAVTATAALLGRLLDGLAVALAPQRAGGRDLREVGRSGQVGVV